MLEKNGHPHSIGLFMVGVNCKVKILGFTEMFFLVEGRV